MKKKSNEKDYRNEKEQAEDFLEAVYLLQKKGQPLTSKEICNELNMLRWEYKRLCQYLIEHDCIKDGDIETLIPTDYGNIRAREILQKHHYLTDFVQMICKVNRKEAEENACRMEHIITPNVFLGITDYMANGSQSERIVSGWDINRFYENGTYKFNMNLYECEKRYPRILCAENRKFLREIDVTVGEESIVYLTLNENEQLDFELWYLTEQNWRQASRVKKQFAIPSNSFRYTFCDFMPVIEGDIYIAFTENGKMPIEQDYRELNIHLW